MTHHPALASPVELQLHSPPTFWRCEPSWSWVSPPLQDYLLWCVLDGIGRLELNGNTRELGPGICAVFAPGDAPTASHDPRRRLLVFGMHFAVSPTDVVPADRWAELPDRVLLGALARSSDTAYQRGDPLGLRQAKLCLEQLLGLIWDAAHSPQPSATDTAVQEVAQAIRQDPSHDWSVAAMAAQASLSRAQFTRRFVAQHGVPPAQYVIRARVERAHQLLTETGMTVTQVAAALGYTDVAYFSRQYKFRTGTSPGQVRRGSSGPLLVPAFDGGGGTGGRAGVDR